MRLIDADALCMHLSDWQFGAMTDGKHDAEYEVINKVIDGIEKEQTVDAVERKKGKWIKISITDDGYAINYRCSCCKGDDVKYPWKYCPNCGADMRKGEEE